MKPLKKRKSFVEFTKQIFKRVKTKKWYAITIGALALIWFIIRVIPKPQRATYPCQRAAFPIASAFVIWVIGIFSSKEIFKKAKMALEDRKTVRFTGLSILALSIFIVSIFFSQIFESAAVGAQYLSLKQSGNELFTKQRKSINQNIIEPQAYVGIVQSNKADAYDIEFDELNEMIREAVNLAGGFDTLIREGDTVVLKPNVISSRSETGVLFPKEGNGVATDFRTIQIVTNMIREYNTTGKIFIIEASGNGVTRDNIEELGYLDITGIDSIILLDEFEGDWYDTSSPELEQVSLPEEKRLYPSDNKYYLNKIYKNAQVVISLPCLKSHGLTGITGSVKNVGIGATPVQIYGNGPDFPAIVQAARWGRINHGNYTTTAVPLDQWIHDFYMCRPVDYVILDGLQGVEYGPYPGGMTGADVALSSVQKNLRIMLAGKDALAVDAIHALIAGFDPYMVGHLQYLAEDEMGCINPAFIKIKGKQVHEIKTRFNEISPGRNTRYNDFEEPWIELPEPGSIINHELNVDLELDEEVVKLEIAYNDTVFPEIIVDNFESFSFSLADHQTDISKVQIMAYDKYLNCKTFTPDHIIISNPQKPENPLTIFPVPAQDYINIKCSQFNNDATAYIISVNGKIKQTETLKTTNKDQYRIDISSLEPGNYVLFIQSGKKQYTSKFIKE